MFLLCQAALVSAGSLRVSRRGAHIRCGLSVVCSVAQRDDQLVPKVLFGLVGRLLELDLVTVGVTKVEVPRTLRLILGTRVCGHPTADEPLDSVSTSSTVRPTTTPVPIAVGSPLISTTESLNNGRPNHTRSGNIERLPAALTRPQTW